MNLTVPLFASATNVARCAIVPYTCRISSGESGSALEVREWNTGSEFVRLMQRSRWGAGSHA